MPSYNPGLSTFTELSDAPSQTQLDSLLSRLSIFDSKLITVESRLNSVCSKLLGVSFSTQITKDSVIQTDSSTSLDTLVCSLEAMIFRIEETLDNLY